jgi:hypothetical protein
LGDDGRVFPFRFIYPRLDPRPDSPVDGSPAANGLFGAALARLKDDLQSSPGDYLLIGAPGEDEKRGVVYLYLNGVEKILRLTPEPPLSLSPGAAFGSAIAAAGQLALVGAPGTPATGGGSAFLLNFHSLPDPPMFSKLESPKPTAGTLFGAAVALSSDGSYALVGAPFEDGGKGAVYVFKTSDASLVCTFVDPNPAPAAQDGFGTSLATGNDLVTGKDFVIVGAPFADAGLVEGAGEAHVFDLTFDDTTPCPPSGIATPTVTITNPAPSFDAGFGTAVAVTDLRILVGAPLDDPPGAPDGGVVYQFDGDRMSQDFGKRLTQERLLPVFPGFSHPGARFGSVIAPIAVTGSDPVVAVSAPGNGETSNAAVLVFAEDISTAAPLALTRAFAQRDCSQIPGCTTPPDGGPAICSCVASCSDSEGCHCQDDGIDCTEDICMDRECVHTPRDTLCGDGKRCDPVKGCVFECACDDGDPCTIDSCDPDTGSCDHSLRAEGCRCGQYEPCADDGNECNGILLCVRCKG